MDDDWERIAEKGNIISPKTPNINKWDGEDEEEDVKESWEDEEEKRDEEKVDVKLAKSKLKKALPQKDSEKDRQRREEDVEQKSEMTPEEKLAEKLKLQKLQEDSDLKTAMETFGIIESSIDTLHPTSKEEFMELAQAISAKVANYKHSDEFSNFVEELIRDVCVNLPAAELRKIKLTVENLHLEKQKLEKEKSKKAAPKGKTKIKLRVEGDSVKSSIGDYGYDYDYDDFM